MSTLNNKSLELELTINPDLTFKKVKGSNVKNHYDFGGFKRGITVRRNNFKAYLNIKGVLNKDICKQIGVSEYTLKQFVNRRKIKIEKASKIVEFLNNNSIEKLIKDANKINLEPTEPIDFKGDEKGKIRDLLVNRIGKSSLKSGYLFTLPSSKAIFETQLNFEVDNNFHYIACENDKDIYFEMQETIVNKKLLMSTHKGDASEVIMNLKPNSLSHSFNDYCRTFVKHENEINYMITNNVIKVGGYLGMTFSQRDCNKHQQSSLEYHKQIIDLFNLSVEPSVKGGVKAKLLSMIGNNYKLVEFIPYQDNSAMIFALLKRIK